MTNYYIQELLEHCEKNMSPGAWMSVCQTGLDRGELDYLVRKKYMKSRRSPVMVGTQKVIRLEYSLNVEL